MAPKYKTLHQLSVLGLIPLGLLMSDSKKTDAKSHLDFHTGVEHHFMHTHIHVCITLQEPGVAADKGTGQLSVQSKDREEKYYITLALIPAYVYRDHWILWHIHTYE